MSSFLLSQRAAGEESTNQNLSIVEDVELDSSMAELLPEVQALSKQAFFGEDGIAKWRERGSNDVVIRCRTLQAMMVYIDTTKL